MPKEESVPVVVVRAPSPPRVPGRSVLWLAAHVVFLLHVAATVRHVLPCALRALPARWGVRALADSIAPAAPTAYVRLLSRYMRMDALGCALVFCGQAAIAAFVFALLAGPPGALSRSIVTWAYVCAAAAHAALLALCGWYSGLGASVLVAVFLPALALMQRVRLAHVYGDGADTWLPYYYESP